MGYFDKYLMHEDGRNKGMNSTSSEKGTDGKKNNTSEYNHQYYMKNKDKWRDNDSKVKATYHEYDENDPDQDEKHFDEKNRLGNTDFFGYQKPDGSWVILEEDMKWTLPAGVDKASLIKSLEDYGKELSDKRANGGKWTFDDWLKGANEAINRGANGKSGGEKEFDVDAAARDVIRGKYGNGAERRAALGDDYAEVQKRVNEILGGKTSSEPKMTSKNASKPVDGPKETPHANFQSSNSTSSAPRAREKNVTGTGTGLYRRDKVEDNKPRKREKNVTGSGTGLYTRGKVGNSEEDTAKKGNRTYMKHYFVDESESLEHHGIKGQKWGVRRFEKAGGGLTTAGRARYQTDSNGNYQKLKSAKADYKQAKREYSDSFHEAYNMPVRHLPRGAHNNDDKRTKAWEDVSEKAKALDSKKQAYKEAKKEYKQSKPGLSEKQKKALKIGAAVTATTLATYGVYKVSQLNKKAKAGLSEIDKIDAKVLLDRSNDYRKNAMNLAEAARKSNKEGRADVAKSLLETSNSMLSRGNYDKTSADKLLERAQKANYSLREKNLYLQSQSDSFSGTDKLIMDLLKKNSATLSSLGF